MAPCRYNGTKERPTNCKFPTIWCVGNFVRPDLLDKLLEEAGAPLATRRTLSRQEMPPQHALFSLVGSLDCYVAKRLLTVCYVSTRQKKGIHFDLVSCQFAIHYSWTSEADAKAALMNAAKRLRPGGLFVGTTTDAYVMKKKLDKAQGSSFGNSLYKCAAAPEFPSPRPRSCSAHCAPS